MALKLKKVHIAIIIAIIIVLIAVLALINYAGNPVGSAGAPPSPTLQVTPTAESGTATPIRRTTMHTTLSQPRTTVTMTTEHSISPTVPTIATSTTMIIPPSFSFSITPIAGSAQRGETITYIMDISPEGNFQAPIDLDLTVTALFFHQVYDLGTQYPPYPKRILYDFQVPGYIPPGTTLVGVLRAEGDGVVREEGLTLLVH